MPFYRYPGAARTAALAILGTTNDAGVAEQTGIPASTLCHWRRKQHIPAYRLARTTARYLALLRTHPEGLTARQIQAALGSTRQAAFFMLHALCRRWLVERHAIPCVGIPGRTHLLVWQLAPSRTTHKEDAYAPGDERSPRGHARSRPLAPGRGVRGASDDDNT